MNRKNTLIVVFMVIGALVVSAFSLVAITNENNAASLQRGRAADAARYTAMAKFYTGQASPAANLSWPPRPDFSILDQQAIILVTGGANGLEIYYSSERGTYVAPRSGLDIYHQSEWNAATVNDN